MKLAILILLLLADSGAASAQTNDTATTSAATTTQALSAQPGGTTRDQLSELLNKSPRELPTVLAIEPSLIANDQFLAAHPELARFVAAHSEVKLQPTFYLADFAGYAHAPRQRLLEPFMAFSAFLLVTWAVLWLIRTIIEQRRWSRLAQTQSDVHNKILDRFGSSAELLDYVKTPAGSRFLESAPIQLYAERTKLNPSLARVIGSVQIGVILAAGAIGALVVSGRYADETGQGLFALGVIGLCVGGGFIVSGIVSMFLARRLETIDDAAGEVK